MSESNWAATLQLAAGSPAQDASSLTTPASEPAEALAQQLQEIELLLAGGEQQRAAEDIRRCHTDAATKEERLRLAQLAERAGELPCALKEYTQLLAANPADVTVMLSLARLYHDSGDSSQAIMLYEQLLKLQPHHVEAALEVGALKESAGLVEEAIRIYHQAAGDGQQPQLEAAARAARSLMNSSQEFSASACSAQDCQMLEVAAEIQVAHSLTTICPTDADAVLFADLFAGREGVYARQWHREGQRAGYTPVHEPFTPTVAYKHLLGTYTVGIYPLRLDNTVGFLCFDIDLSQEDLRRASNSSRMQQANQDKVQAVADQIQQQLTRQSIPSYIEDSGMKGRHVWVFFESPIPAIQVRYLARLILRSSDLPRTVAVEVFPRQSRVKAGSWGNLIKLPLGIHRATGRRTCFVDALGSPVASQLAFLAKIRRVTSAEILTAMQRLAASADRPETIGLAALDDSESDAEEEHNWQKILEVASGEIEIELDSEKQALEATRGQVAASTVSNIELSMGVVEAPYRIEEDLEVQQIFSGCAVLDDINRRLKTEHAISHEERLVITYTLGCLNHGPQAVNALLDQAHNLDPGLRLVNRLRSNPTSCARIRSKLFELAERVNCNCQFSPGEGGYPTPLLHLRASHSSSIMEVRRLELDQAVRNYLKLRSEQVRIGRALEDLARQLRSLMAEQGLNSLSTSYGTLRPGANEHEMILEL